MRKNIGTRKGMNPALARVSGIVKENMFINAAWKVNMLISLMVLHDKFGYGRQRLERFMDEYAMQLDAYNTGHIESVKDFEQVLKDECGIEIERVKQVAR